MKIGVIIKKKKKSSTSQFKHLTDLFYEKIHSIITHDFQKIPNFK